MLVISTKAQNNAIDRFFVPTENPRANPMARIRPSAIYDINIFIFSFDKNYAKFNC